MHSSLPLESEDRSNLLDIVLLLQDRALNPPTISKRKKKEIVEPALGEHANNSEKFSNLKRQRRQKADTKTE